MICARLTLRQAGSALGLSHNAVWKELKRNPELNDQVNAARFQAQIEPLLSVVVHDVVEVRAIGEGPLAQLLDLTLVGDFVSLHMAAQEGIDPGPVPVKETFLAR